MKNQNKKLTIEEILDSEFLNEMIKKEDQELKESGWTYAEVKSLAKSIKASQ